MTSEPETVEWIQAHATPETVFYDVGACVGEFSRYALEQGAKVYAFEPHPGNYLRFVENHHLQRATALPIALSDKETIDGLGVTNLEPESVGHTLGECVEKNRAFERHIPVISARLDWVVERFGLSCPSMMKIDVDGCELRVLNGAFRLLRERLQHVMVEVNGGDTKVGELMKHAGFKLTNSVVVASFASNCFFERVNA